MVGKSRDSEGINYCQNLITVFFLFCVTLPHSLLTQGSVNHAGAHWKETDRKNFVVDIALGSKKSKYPNFTVYVDGLMQDFSISGELVLEILQSCTKGD